jgi:hypothetical protein
MLVLCQIIDIKNTSLGSALSLLNPVYIFTTYFLRKGSTLSRNLLHGSPPLKCPGKYSVRSRDSVVGIATRYGLEGPGIESRWGEVFRTHPDRLRGPPSLLHNGCRVFPGGKGGRGVMLTTHPLLVPRLRKSWAIPPLTLWVLLGLLRGSLYPQIFGSTPAFLQSCYV